MCIYIMSITISDTDDIRCCGAACCGFWSLLVIFYFSLVHRPIAWTEWYWIPERVLMTSFVVTLVLRVLCVCFLGGKVEKLLVASLWCVCAANSGSESHLACV